MSWPLREITLAEHEAKIDLEVPVGSCWRIPLDHRYDDGVTYGKFWADFLSPEFRTSGRDYVIVVQLPFGGFCIDHKATDGPSGWTVTGELPAITVAPSINARGSYHGWIQNGVLTDDCEGRTFPR